MPRNYDFGFKTQTMLRLAYIEAVLRATKVILPVPTRASLIGLIENGTLVGHKTSYGYLVTEASFKDYVKSLQPDAYQMIE
jgi:hypothetical protein